MGASIKGWYSYLADPASGNASILQDNPETSDDKLAFSFEQLPDYGIIPNGVAEAMVIDTMTDKLWE